MQSPTLIRARELDQWAKSPQAKVLLPELMGRLVKATVPREHLSKCDFAAEAEIHRPGYDGTTVSDQRTLYVPSGVTYWELGCDAKPEKKAQSDYDKRIEEHEARTKAGETDDISQATFIAVTACDWHAKKLPTKKGKGKAKKLSTVKGTQTFGGSEVWEKARAKENRFKAVKAYDSNQLEQWIREAPAVGRWLAREMGKPVSGIVDIGSHWLDIQAALKRPTLPPEVLLVNRASIATGFKDWVAGAAREYSVRAPSAVEVVAVFVAWVHTLPAAEADAISSRAIIVEDRDTWRALVTSMLSLILVAAPSLEADRELFSGAVRNGHYVLRHADFRADSRSGAMDLERMRRFDLQQALEKAGLGNAEAQRVAQAAGGNFTILRRVYANSPAVQFPAWSQERGLALLLLAGAWEDERPADREIIERITGLSYSDACVVAAKWRIESDPPLRLIAKERGEGRVWEFLSPLDAWDSLNGLLDPALLAVFEEAAVEVLTEDDPGLSLPPDDRPMAAIKGLRRRFSHDLRQGIAEILAIGATRQDESGIGKVIDYARHARSVVRRVLPDGCGWQRWASLGQLLSSLVEAAPDEFLSAVEHDLASPDPQTVELLRQEIPPSGIGGAAYHSGLLWALETAAWPSQHLNRVVLVMAQLTEKDPGGKWGNRPLGSAARIFFPWRPQTVAPVGERIDALNLICRESPAAGWKIVVSLIPKTHSAISDSSKPSYRDWAAGWTDEMTYADYFTFIDALVEVGLQLVGNDLSRWWELLDEISSLYSASRKAYERVRDALEALVGGGVTGELKEGLWQKVRVVVHNHSRFHDAEWAMPPEEVARWTAMQERLTPDD